MSGFSFKLRITYQHKQTEFKPFGNLALALEETAKAFGPIESLVLQYNNLHNKPMCIKSETDYIEMINNFTNELYYPDLEYAELYLVNEEAAKKDESISDDEEEEEVNEDEQDESVRNKHSNKFNEQKRIYYIKEKKEMQREEQRKYDLETGNNSGNTQSGERSKAKKKSKGK